MQGVYMWSNPSVKEKEGLTAGGHGLRNTLLYGTHALFKVYNEIPSRDPLWGQNVTCKIFPELELWFSHNLDFCVWE